jgi:hypothetical protein
VISGTPIKYAGTFSFTIGVTDAGAPAQTTGQAFSITVG